MRPIEGRTDSEEGLIMLKLERSLVASLERIAVAMEEENRMTISNGSEQNDVIRRATDMQRAVLAEAERYRQDQRVHMAACERRYLARLAGEDETETFKH